jgi:enoyl-CoA hydratase/carnithine racemase
LSSLSTARPSCHPRPRDSVRSRGWGCRRWTYLVEGRIARITLDRPERGNGITLEMPRELADCVERANLDPEVHVIALAGNGSGFCGGYDLVASAERMSTNESRETNDGSSIDFDYFGVRFRIS